MAITPDLKKTEQRGYSRGYAAGMRVGRHEALTQGDNLASPMLFDAPITVPTPTSVATPPGGCQIETEAFADLVMAEQRGYERGYTTGVRFGRFKVASRNVRPARPASTTQQQSLDTARARLLSRNTSPAENCEA